MGAVHIPHTPPTVSVNAMAPVECVLWPRVCPLSVFPAGPPSRGVVCVCACVFRTLAVSPHGCGRGCLPACVAPQVVGRDVGHASFNSPCARLLVRVALAALVAGSPSQDPLVNLPRCDAWMEVARNAAQVRVALHTQGGTALGLPA